MIVACERCQTRFQLDEARIPPAGANVRCSRCKHAFFVPHAGASADGETQALMPGAATPGGGPAADASDATRVLAREPAGEPALAAPEEESDWQFNDEPASPASPRRPAPKPRAPRPARDPLRELAAKRHEAPESTPVTLDALGDPTTWNFTGDEDAAPEPAKPAPSAPRVEPAPAASKPPRPAPAVRAEPPAEPLDGPELLAPLPPAPGRAVALAGWAATTALLVAIAGVGLFPRAAARDAAAAPPDTSIPGLRDLRAGVIENALGERLFLVSGRLENAGAEAAAPARAIVVTLLDASGRALEGGEARAVASPGEARLREAPVQELLDEAAAGERALAWTPVAPHDSAPFVAIYRKVPATDTRLRVAAEAPPAAPPPPAAEPAPPAAEPSPTVEPGAAAEPAPAPDATGASPPPPLPSSG